MENVLPVLYILAAAGFILALKWMSSPATARRGVFAGEAGMLLAVVGTLLRFDVVNYQWIFIAFFQTNSISARPDRASVHPRARARTTGRLRAFFAARRASASAAAS